MTTQQITPEMTEAGLQVIRQRMKHDALIGDMPVNQRDDMVHEVFTAMSGAVPPEAELLPATFEAERREPVTGGFGPDHTLQIPDDPPLPPILHLESDHSYRDRILTAHPDLDDVRKGEVYLAGGSSLDEIGTALGMKRPWMTA